MASIPLFHIFISAEEIWPCLAKGVFGSDCACVVCERENVRNWLCVWVAVLNALNILRSFINAIFFKRHSQCLCWRNCEKLWNYLPTTVPEKLLCCFSVFTLPTGCLSINCFELLITLSPLFLLTLPSTVHDAWLNFKSAATTNWSAKTTLSTNWPVAGVCASINCVCGKRSVSSGQFLCACQCVLMWYERGKTHDFLWFDFLNSCLLNVNNYLEFYFLSIGFSEHNCVTSLSRMFETGRWIVVCAYECDNVCPCCPLVVGWLDSVRPPQQFSAQTQ